jgi:tRNA modification GTPase
LIDSQTRAAAKAALRSLSGAFSTEVHQLVDAVTNLRTYIEAAIDFPEEEIDFLVDERITQQLERLVAQIAELSARASNGQRLRDGMTLVIAGLPNAGKSSLMNALTGQDRAIVTAVPGTTRDVLRAEIEIDGLPVHVIDTAGLRDSDDEIEREGVRRARDQISVADHALWVFDATTDPDGSGLTAAGLPATLGVTRVRNKIDLSDEAAGIADIDGHTIISVSAKTGSGIPLLRSHLKALIQFSAEGDGDFSARRRHLDAIGRAQEALFAAKRALQQSHAGELMAEDLRQAQMALAEITGEFSADDLLGEIFANFCIGK